MNMHDIFTKVSNTTQNITSNIKRGAQDLYTQYQQNVQNNQQNLNVGHMGNINPNNGNTSNIRHSSSVNSHSMGNEENPFLQINVPPGTIPPGTYVTVGQYQVMIERHLAEGGFAHVYVVQGQNGKKAVLKQIIVPDQEQVLTFQKEINFMKSVSGNENIVQFFDSQVRARTKSEGSGFEVLILMEYCSDGHVVNLMNSRLKVRLTENEIINIFYSVCKAVAHLHYQNPPIIHRDIKVENVLITSDGKYKLCDFGSATTDIIPPNKSLNIQEIHNLEDDIQKYTTIQYRPPEMCDLYQRRGLNEKVDTWALGIMLYKLCYYTTPFEDGNTLAILNGSYTKPQTPVYSNHIHHLLDIMLVVEPSLRANIYDILSYVTTSILGIPCPITNKYGFKETSSNSNNSPFFAAEQTNSILTSVKQPVVTVPIVQNPNPTPMRRGRPNQKERKPNNNLAAANANAVLASKLATLSYNSEQMKQSANDSFKSSITIGDGHSNTTETNKIPAQPSGGESGSFFTKYSQDQQTDKRHNKDTLRPGNTSSVNQNVSGSKNKNEADQTMLDSIFGKSTNDLFNDSSNSSNNLFYDNWVVDNSSNSFNKLSESRTKDGFANDFFKSSNDLFNSDISHSSSKKVPRPPSFSADSSDSDNQNQNDSDRVIRSNNIPNLTKYKSESFILSNTNPFTKMDSSIINNNNKIDKHDKIENPFSSNESTNESINEPLFEATFEDNFDDNFDNGEYDDHSVSLFGKELNDDKLNSYKIRNEGTLNPMNAKPPRGGNAFSDSIFNNSNNNKHNNNNNNNINKNKDNVNDQEDVFGYSKFDGDDNTNEDAFNQKSPSIKITSPALNTVSVNSKFSNSVNAINFNHDESGSFFTSNKYNNTKEGKDKDKNDNTSNHSSQSTSKLNHSFQRLAKSLKKKPKQKKHILLDDGDDDDDEDYKDDFTQAYSQIEEDDDEDNEVLVNNENLSPPPKNGHVRYPSDPQRADSVKMHQKTRSLSRFPEFVKKEFSSILDNKTKSSAALSPPATQSTNNNVSPVIKNSSITQQTQTQTNPKKKTPPPIPPKPKELKTYVIPKVSPAIPTRQSSRSTKTSPVDNNNSSNIEIPKRTVSSKMPNLQNLKISPINESTSSISSTNLNNDSHVHSGYYMNDEDMVQQLDQSTSSVNDDMENYSNGDYSDQDIFSNGKTKKRSKFKPPFIKH